MHSSRAGASNRGSRSWSVTRRAIPTVVDIVRLSDIPAYDKEKLIAQPLIDGSQSNVRVIKLSPGQALPPHRHGSSDLMLFVVEGEGVLQSENGTVAFAAGSSPFLEGGGEPGRPNQGQVGSPRAGFPPPAIPAAFQNVSDESLAY